MRRVARMMVVGVMAVLGGCGGRPTPAPGGPPQVVATTTIVADMVRQIGGDAVAVTSLMGAGVDPHLYKPSAGDVGRMAAASVVFYGGLHLEGKMTDVLEGMAARGVRTVAVAACLPEDRLISASAFAGVHDPHVWFDIALWAEAVPCVTAALAEVAPAAASAIRQRAADYQLELAALDAEVRAAIAGIPPERRVLVTAHDAFSYFGRAYGLEVLGLLGISTASEAGTGDVQRLADVIAARRVPAVFVETSVPERYIQALRDAVAARGFDVGLGGSLYSDALGSRGTAAATYVGTVRANVTTIVTALSDPAPGAGSEG